MQEHKEEKLEQWDHEEEAGDPRDHDFDTVARGEKTDDCMSRKGGN